MASKTVPFTLEVKDSKATLLSHDDGTGTFEALVSVTNIPDHGNDIIEPGAYRQTIKARPNPRLLRGHDWGRRAGKVLAMEEWMPGDRRLPPDLLAKGAGALWIKGRYNLGTREGQEAYSDLKFDPDNAEWSIGYDCSATENGPRAFRGQDGIRRIKSLDLFECSDVVVGMASGTRALCVKALNAGVLDATRKYSMAELVAITTAPDFKALSDNQGFNAGTVGSATPPDTMGDGVEEGGDIDIDAPANGDRTTDDGEDAFLAEKARLTVDEWIALERHILQTKDWTEFDAQRPTGNGRAPAAAKPDDQKPTTDQNANPAAAPKPANEPTPGQTGGTGGDGDSGGDEKPEAEGGGEGGEGRSPVEGLLESANKLVETIHEGLAEGRERGREWVEKLEPKQRWGGIAVKSLDEFLGDENDEDTPGDTDDPGVNLGEGAATPYVEDANLNNGHGRRDWSAMKGLRLDPLVPRRGQRKDNDDQPRDDHGRWTSGGDGGASGDALSGASHDAVVAHAAGRIGTHPDEILRHPNYQSARDQLRDFLPKQSDAQLADYRASAVASMTGPNAEHVAGMSGDPNEHEANVAHMASNAGTVRAIDDEQDRRGGNTPSAQLERIHREVDADPMPHVNHDAMMKAVTAQRGVSKYQITSDHRYNSGYVGTKYGDAPQMTNRQLVDARLAAAQAAVTARGSREAAYQLGVLKGLEEEERTRATGGPLVNYPGKP